jgi:hypothetical protein
MEVDHEQLDPDVAGRRPGGGIAYPRGAPAEHAVEYRPQPLGQGGIGRHHQDRERPLIVGRRLRLTGGRRRHRLPLREAGQGERPADQQR